MLKLLLTILVITSFSVCAQTSNVPKQVKNAFAQKFPTAKNVKWDMESETEWEAEFKLNNEEYTANFASDGTWKETEYEIEKSDIPQLVKQTLQKEIGDFDIEEVEISETIEGKVYEFALEKDETDLEVAISADGKVVKNEVKKGEDEEDND